jgi:hypothetical protein
MPWCQRSASCCVQSYKLFKNLGFVFCDDLRELNCKTETLRKLRLTSDQVLNSNNTLESPIYRSFFLAIYLSFFLSTYLSLSFFLSVYLPIYLSIYPYIYLSIKSPAVRKRATPNVRRIYGEDTYVSLAYFGSQIIFCILLWLNAVEEVACWKKTRIS